MTDPSLLPPRRTASAPAALGDAPADRHAGAAADPRPTRTVLRALGELRRGAPVLLAGLAGGPLVVVAAETASAEGLADADRVAGHGAGSTGTTLLLMPRARAAVLRDGVPGPGEDGGPPVAARIGDGRFASLPDGSWHDAAPSRHAPPAAPPDGSDAALALLKLGRLLPVAAVAAATGGAAARAAAAGVLVAEAGNVLAHPLRTASALAIVAEAPVPLADAPDARLVAFRSPDAGIEHVAIVIGDPSSRPAPLVRLHSECFTGDLIGSLRCDCGDQLRGAIRAIAAEGHGAVLYLAQEGRGIGLVNKLRAYSLQDEGLDTIDANRALGWDADERSFAIAAAMLDRLGLGAVRLLTNNPDKIAALAAFGIVVTARVPILVPANGVNDAYLRTKRHRFGHLGG